MPDFPTGTVTFLFTDIEGSTRLWEEHPEAMRVALARHDILVRETLVAHGGSVFKTVGDAFCVAFATAPDAVEAALAVQRAVRAEPWGEAGPLRVRVALHTGAAEPREGDYFGPPLNRVARLLDAGHGGQVLLSQTTHDLVQEELPPETSLGDLGWHRLRDLQRSEHVFELRHADLAAEFPPLQTLDTLPNNLPQQLTSFIGRERESAQVKQFLETTRLVTLTGVGGTGKTRLAQHVAADVLEQYPDGVWLVELAPLVDSALLPQAVAVVLGVQEEPGQALTETLAGFLKPRTLLLVLDNCEHLLAEVVRLADALLRACPLLRVLASSREPLGLAGERAYRVPSLSVPDPGVQVFRSSGVQGKLGAAASAPESAPPEHLNTRTPEHLLQFGAVRLFLERAEFSSAGFAITDQNAPAVAQVCCRLDGIPLAIELAAARVKSMPVERLAERLDDRFRLLTGGSRTALPRQQTLRALIDWSYDLLAEPERALLQRLSIFAGGWTLEAAEAVCHGVGIEEWEILDLLSTLVEKSLVQYEEQNGTARYRLLETIREYSRERLQTSEQEGELLARHAQFYLKLAEEADAQFRRSVQETWLDRVEKEYENLRAAMAWCLTEQGEVETGRRLARALTRFWEMRAYMSEGRAFLAQVIARVGADPPTLERAEALNAAAVLAWMQGDAAASRALFDESLVIERSLGDTAGVAWSLHHLGHVAALQAEYGKAQGLYAESLAIFRELNNQPGLAASLADQGNMALKLGDLAAARAFYEESLRLSRERKNRVSIAVALNNLGKIAREQGDTAAAWALHRESLTIRRELGDNGGYPWSLEAFARLAAPEDPERAARWWGAAEALREALGLPLPPNEREEYDRFRSAARAALGDPAFAGAWAAGRAMTPEQAVASALQEGAETTPRPRVTSRRDREEPRRAAGGRPPAPALLATKLALPALSPGLLPRPRLTARLNPSTASVVARLALLDASAGSGKSSVVRQWCEEQPNGSVAWLSLDRDDNDPERFLLYLCAAMESVAPTAAAPVQALLQAAEPTSPEAALTLLLNGIAELAQPVTLVLDDYHEIEAVPVHELVSFLVEHLPPALFLILATRSDPPLPLARLRLQGRLIEVRDDELRFTEEETGQFLQERTGLTLTPEMVQRLAERTEGWIAGLQMAALSLQGRVDATRLRDALTGTDRYLVDYFFEEVLQRLPAEVQAFLGKTAFLRRLCAPLCEAVTGMPNGQAMLERLEATHLFLIPMDRERQWYRYHPLFADVLQARLLPEQEEPLAVLQARAAAWHEAEETAGKPPTQPGESSAPPPTTHHPGTASDLVEPLSERELEVLRLVAAGLRNAEIASQLFLAVGTVQRHIHNLYGKLGVSNRTSALARARALGLL